MQPYHCQCENKDNRQRTLKQDSLGERKMELWLNDSPEAAKHVRFLLYGQINVLITRYNTRNGVVQRKYTKLGNYLGKGN